MQTVTVSREIAAPVDAVRDAMDDLEAFTRAAGFDEVEVSGRTIHVANRVGIAHIELELAVVDDADATLRIDQRDGIFEEMQTTYDVQSMPDGTDVTATTEFALDVAIVGAVLDATVIKRQRRRELTAQLEYLESTAGDQSSTA
ncbi:SRPBCC family protein [Halovivax limisalsi]|uniref:SRPBCC family protein n=1 Tax=Halovivax limisalsi TaxID=1453760 RepID=UPI001FFC6C89|nr:SRPBCC family protein [Halovivax limisalsi]